MLWIPLWLAAVVLAVSAGPAWAIDGSSSRVRAVVLKDFPPFYQLDAQGRPEGFALDLLTHAAREAGFETDLRVVDSWAAAMEELRTGRVDLIPGIGLNPDREAEFLFSHLIETVPVSIFVRASDHQFRGLEDIRAGRKTAVLDQSAANVRLAREPGVNLVIFPELDPALFALLAGEVDALVVPEPILWQKARRIDVDGRIKTVGPPLLDLKRGWLVRKTDQAFLDRVNPLLQAYVQSGRYAELLAKWYGPPRPFWTPARVGWIAGGAAALLFVLFGALYTFQTRRTNRRLKATVADLRAAERTLAEREALLQSVFRAAPTGIGVVRNREFTWTNDLLKSITGYEPEELLGQNARMLYPTQEDFDFVGREKYRQIGEKGTGTVETRWRRKDGEIIDILLSSTPMDPADHMVGVVFTALDITGRKKAERERERLIGELEAKNAELERFTYTVSHDLKSPLITIKGFAGLFEKDLKKVNLEAASEDIRIIREAADRMNELLDELLELSRIGRLANPAVPVPLSELARDALVLLAGRVAESKAEVRIPDNLPVVYGDRPRLLEVFQNLCDNALKYMGEQPAPAIVIGAESNGEKVKAWVRDNGRGIEPRFQERVFRLFDQVDAVGQGKGVGLAIVKRIVEVHGGRVWVESEGPGRGSTFFFTLPKWPGSPLKSPGENLPGPEKAWP